MKVLLLVIFLFSCNYILAQPPNLGCLLLQNCSACIAAAGEGCSYCHNGTFGSPNADLFLCIPTEFCPEIISTCTALPVLDLTTHANFGCQSGIINNTMVTNYNASDLNVFAYYLPPPAPVGDVEVEFVAQGVDYLAVAPPNNNAMLGFQFVAFDVMGDAAGTNFRVIKADGIGAFLVVPFVFEFFPTNANGTWAGEPQVSNYTFTKFTLSPCNSTPFGSTTLYTLTLTDPNGWIINCKLTADPTTDANGYAISPLKSKCDFTFGNYPYVYTNTSLGVVVFFVMAGLSVTTGNPAIQACNSNPGSFCLVSASGAYAGRFDWTKTTKNGLTISSSGFKVATASAAQFFIPSTSTSSIAKGVSTEVDVSTFATASLVIFSVKHPANGDVWDPQLSVGTAQSVDPTASSQHSGSNIYSYSLLLIVAALLSKYYL